MLAAIGGGLLKGATLLGKDALAGARANIRGGGQAGAETQPHGQPSPYQPAPIPIPGAGAPQVASPMAPAPPAPVAPVLPAPIAPGVNGMPQRKLNGFGNLDEAQL